MEQTLEGTATTTWKVYRKKGNTSIHKNNLVTSRLLMASAGAWLKAQGSWLMAQGSWLMAKKKGWILN